MVNRESELGAGVVAAQVHDLVPIPGTKRRTFLNENVGAADVVLTSDGMAMLDAVLADWQVSGAR
jgi:aryl-alcohol dehydrogenase-like predicted oxidoreductase